MTTRPPKVIPEKCRNFVLPTVRKSYKSRDAILYALGVGVSTNPLDSEDLKFTYEGTDEFSILPTYAVVVPAIEGIFDGLLSCPGIPLFNPMMLLHGEERLTIHQPLPTEATIECTSRIVDVEDKRKGALLYLSCELYEADPMTERRRDGGPMAVIELSVFIRGIGGFGGSKAVAGPITGGDASKRQSPPDWLIERATQPNQAILYRLSGDTNPLHIDPSMAALGGMERPILHGLCSFGIAAHTFVKCLSGNQSDALRVIEGRFSAPVFPGDTLQILVWMLDDRQILFEVKDVQTGKVCISDGKASFARPLKRPTSHPKQSAL